MGTVPLSCDYNSCFWDLRDSHQTVSSLSSREGFKIQVTAEAGSYDSLRALAQTSPDFNVLVLNFERINVLWHITKTTIFTLDSYQPTFFQVYHLN